MPLTLLAEPDDSFGQKRATDTDRIDENLVGHRRPHLGESVQQSQSEHHAAAALAPALDPLGAHRVDAFRHGVNGSECLVVFGQTGMRHGF